MGTVAVFGRLMGPAPYPAVVVLPRANSQELAVQYQRVYHPTLENFLQDEVMAYPGLQKRWQTQSQRDELIGASASVQGENAVLNIYPRVFYPLITSNSLIGNYINACSKW